MKHLILWLTLVPQLSFANSLASIYNGEQYDLGKIFLAQDANKPEDFYVMPSSFSLAPPQYYWDEKIQDYASKSTVSHEIVEVAGKKYSSYTLRFKLDQPSRQDVRRATNRLWNLRANARIKGLVPICGVKLGYFGFEFAQGEKPTPENSVNPGGEYIRYSLRSNDSDRCTSLVSLKELSVVYRVPLELEPEAAKALTSDTGLVLPPVEVIMPYKYTDKVSIKIDTQSVIDQLKATGGFKGTIKKVALDVQGSVERMWNNLTTTGVIKIDCQSDQAVCERYYEIARDVIAKTFYIYTPLATAGDTTPLTLSDNNKSTPSLFDVKVNTDLARADRKSEFSLDMDNPVYSSMRTQVQFKAFGVSPDVLAKEVRDLL